MFIKRLELKNFRNYTDLSIDFDSSTNILYGNNAQGKTNILEASYIGSTTKSHKGSKDKDIIKFGEDESHIRLEIEKKDIDYRIDMHLRKNKNKSIAVNGVSLKKAAELLGILNIVFFSPEDLSIIKNGPAERRKFIDMELSQLDPIYLYNLSNYNKAVDQRNKLLKDMYDRNEVNDLLDVWDEKIISFGKEIIKRRLDFIEKLNVIISEIHYKLSGGLEKCFIFYEPDCNISEYEDKLHRSREKDLRYKTTSVGPHRDDVRFMVNDIDIRKYGSQGQQRTAALSLKLSEIELVKKMAGDTPVLLLDDVLSELDSNRQNYLLESIKDIQTIITCTGLDEFVNNRFKINRTYHVVNGSVEIER